MGLVSVEFGVHPWHYGALDGTTRTYLEQVAIWHVERQAKRDEAIVRAIGRLMGAKV